MSITEVEEDRLYKVRWREGGRPEACWFMARLKLAKKIERKKLSLRDENRHLDVKKEINYRMTDLIDRLLDTVRRSRRLQQIERRASSKAFDRSWAGCSYERWMEWLCRSGTTS